MTTSRRTLKQQITVSCIDCRMVFRVENITPLTTSKRSIFCAGCGSDNVQDIKLELYDQWYAMAASFGLPQKAGSVELIKKFFENWDAEEYPNFKDFVQSVVEEITKNDNND